MKKDIDQILKDVLDYLDGNWDGTEEETEESGGFWGEMHRQHGPVVEYRMEAYHDVKVFADGYEWRISIGD